MRLTSQVALGARCRRFKSCLPDSFNPQSETDFLAAHPWQLFRSSISLVPSRCREHHESPHGNSSHQLICLGSVLRQSGDRPTKRYAHREWWRQLSSFSGSTSRQLMPRPQTVSNACDHKAERIQDHPTALRSWWDSFNASMESNTPEWASVKDACAHLGLGSTALRQLQWDGILTPGKHWIYANGQKSGPVRFNIPAIRQWQAEKTIEHFNSRTETYQESN